MTGSLVNSRRKAQSKSTASALACLGCGLACAAFAQDASRVTIDVSPCLELTSPEERLACYEAQIGERLHGADQGARDDSAPPAAAVAAPAEPPAVRPAMDPNAAAGLAVEQLLEETLRAGQPDERFGLRPPSERRGEQPQLIGTIASVTERAPNQRLLVLENGQVWHQTLPQWYPVRAGQRVRIYSTRWGASYRLAAEELGGFIQVERIK